jgi:hypothetical protein
MVIDDFLSILECYFDSKAVDFTKKLEPQDIVSYVKIGSDCLEALSYIIVNTFFRTLLHKRCKHYGTRQSLNPSSKVIADVIVSQRFADLFSRAEDIHHPPLIICPSAEADPSGSVTLPL